MRAGTKALWVALCVVAIGVGTLLLWQPGMEEGAAPASQAVAAPRPAAGETAAPLESSPAAAPGSVEPARRQVEGLVEAPAAVAANIALTGRLVGRQGNPLAGVAVRYLGSELEVIPLPPFSGQSRRAQVVTTDGDGRFRITAPAGRAGQLSLESEDLVLAGLAQRELGVPASERDKDLGELIVVGAATIDGFVRDAAGRAIEGIEVGITSAAQVIEWAPRRVVSAASGRFTFRGLWAGEHRLTTASPRFAPASVTVAVAESGTREDVVIVLEEGAAIAGRVLDDLGRPIAGITVGAYRKRELGESVTIRGIAQGETVQTDQDGRFRLGGIEDATVTIRASGKGHQPQSRADVAKGTVDLILTLARSGAVEGVLVDAQGAPLAGSRIRALGRGDLPLLPFQQATATSDAEGRFVLDSLAPGLVRLVAEGSGHVPAEVEVTVPPGETATGVRMVAARGASVAITVVDQTGEPVRDAEVEVVGTDAGGSSGAAPGRRFRSRRVERRSGEGPDDVVIDDGSPRTLGRGRTGADGKAEIGGLLPGAVQVRASHATLAPALPVALTLAPSARAEASLTLRQGGAVELRVVDADRVEVAGATITVEGPVGDDAETQTVKSGDDGMARVGPLAAGSYSAVLRLPARPIRLGAGSFMMLADQDTLESSRVRFLVAAGDTAAATLVQPVLTTVLGTLTNAEGAVPAGSVELAPQGAPELPLPGGYSATTDEQGRFRIEGVPPGRYALRYAGKGQVVPAEESLAIDGQRELERHLVLSGGSVKVTVRDGDGEPLPRAKVSLRRVVDGAGGTSSTHTMIAMISVVGDGGEQSMELGGGRAAVQTDDDGKAVVDAVPAGSYTLTVRHPRHVDHDLHGVEVQTGATRDLGTVQLTLAGGLRGTVVDAAGRTPEVAFVEIVKVGGTEERPVTAMQGTFKATSLAPGRYRVRARGPGPATGESGPEQEVEVAAGKTSDVQLVLR